MACRVGFNQWARLLLAGRVAEKLGTARYVGGNEIGWQ